MTCKDCPYYWKEEWEKFPGCHFEERGPDDRAPCEYEDEEGY